MPDIMMCRAEACPLSQQCHRHEDSGTKPDPLMQSWWMRDDASPTGDACDNFWRTTCVEKPSHERNLP